MQDDAVHVKVNEERQGSGSVSRSDKGEGGKEGGKGKSKKGGKGRRRKMRNTASKFEGECRYCQKKGHKKTKCRKMKADLAAGKCDKHGKPTGVNAHSDRHDAAFTRKRAMHRVWRAPSRCRRWSQCTSRSPVAVRTQTPGPST